MPYLTNLFKKIMVESVEFVTRKSLKSGLPNPGYQTFLSKILNIQVKKHPLLRYTVFIRFTKDPLPSYWFYM